MAHSLRGALRLFYAQNGFFLAAGLSFYVLVCIVPFLLLLVAGGGFLLSDETVGRRVVDQLARGLPVYQAEIRRLVAGIVQARGVSGIVGTLVLILFATQLFAATRFVLNRMFGTGERGFFHGVVLDVGMMTLVASLFLVTIGITAALGWAKRTFVLFDNGVIEATFFEWIGLLLALAANTLLFAMLYRFVPLRRIPWGSVLTGSFAAATLWEIAKQLFRWYILRVGVYSAVYGSLGVTIALVMWIYYSAVVFVLGAALICAREERVSDTPVARVVRT